MSFCRLLPAVLLFSALVGCQSFGDSSVASMKRPAGESHARKNARDDETDPWIKEAGTIARHEHIPDTVEDPLGLRKFFVSDRARDIERNLGVGN